MGNTIHMNNALEAYLDSVTVDEPEILKELRTETAKIGDLAAMQISWHQGLFMQFLAKLINAKSYVELGTFTGYSAIAMAKAMGPNGKVYTFDHSDEWTSTAKHYWAKANVDQQISLIMGDAKATLPEFAESFDSQIDMSFIDADKQAIPGYFDTLLSITRPGGLILVDNVLWSGRVADETETNGNTAAFRAFNKRMKDDERVERILTPIGDGLTLAMKR